MYVTGGQSSKLSFSYQMVLCALVVSFRDILGKKLLGETSKNVKGVTAEETVILTVCEYRHIGLYPSSGGWHLNIIAIVFYIVF